MMNSLARALRRIANSIDPPPRIPAADRGDLLTDWPDDVYGDNPL